MNEKKEILQNSGDQTNNGLKRKEDVEIIYEQPISTVTVMTNGPR